MISLGQQIRTAARRVALGEIGVLVTVAATAGSAPRERGAAMLVFDKDIIGTIGGGALEHGAIKRARESLTGQATPPEVETIPLGPAIGQCCGGSVDLRLRKIDARHTHPLWDWLDIVETPVKDLWLFGAGHVGGAVARALEPLDFAVTWIDSRPDMIPDNAPVAKILTSRAPHHAVSATPAGAMILVMTHSHAQDFDIVNTALGRADLPFVGLIGSATKRARFLARLKARGHGDQALARLVCPIGIDGIAGKQPAVIAASVAAQIIQIQEKKSAELGAPMALSG